MTTPLTNREHQILELIACGQTTEQIAQKLSISISTVETHRRNMFHKLKVQSVVGLLKEGLKHGWINIDNL